MKLKIDRRWRKDTYTIGILYVNGVRFCETVEDKDRGLSSSWTDAAIKIAKIFGETAIPTGTYKIVMSYSSKFKNKSWAKKYGGQTPELVNVNGFSGVRIHPGNNAADSLGCILPGNNKVKGGVINSQKVYYELMDKYLMPAWSRKEEITITIK